MWVNADLNGAGNILAFGTLRERKVETQLGLSLVKVCRRVLTLALQISWETKTKKATRCGF
ncbi:MAG: hypothetical protein F6K39_02985 [Okeania sp. SIO3B3]|nr:hypothetical protein [Okeania sp. SIO3B3]